MWLWQMSIPPSMDELQWSNLDSRHNFSGGTCGMLLLRYWWLHYCVLSWLWWVFVSPVMDSLHSSNLDRRCTFQQEFHWVLILSCWWHHQALTNQLLINPFQPSVAFWIETSHLICRAKQMTDFCMKRYTRLKWVNVFSRTPILNHLFANVLSY